MEERGLYMNRYFLNKEEADHLLEWCESKISEMTHVGKRSNGRVVLQYSNIAGRIYAYGGTVNASKIHVMPPTISRLALRIQDYLSSIGIDMPGVFTNCIINCYQPGQGISKHTDDRKFGPVIACLTITRGFGRMMRFTDVDTVDFELFTPHGSLYVMSGDSRYLFEHEMKKRLKDYVSHLEYYDFDYLQDNGENGMYRLRDVVFSITFRC